MYFKLLALLPSKQISNRNKCKGNKTHTEEGKTFLLNVQNVDGINEYIKS